MRERNLRHLAALLSQAPDESLAGMAFGLHPAASGGAEQSSDAPPPEFTWREYLIFLLTVDSQIEHSLMVQYLYAAWSLGGPNVPAAHHESVARWRQMLLGIAKEEMGHLATVQNALRFLNAPLALDREDYPWDAGFAPFEFALEPLTRKSLAKYILAESPETWPDDVSAGERQEIEDLATDSGTKPVNRVSLLFKKIVEILESEVRLPAEQLHPESYPVQASWDEWGRGYGKGARGSSISGTVKTPDVLIMRMSSRQSAIAALNAVASQGEAPAPGSADDLETSHFRRFLQIWQEWPKEASWSPALDLPVNPAVDGLGAGNQTARISHPEAAAWGNLFNLRYRMLLSFLGHSFYVTNASGQDRRGPIINRIFGEMYNLRAISAIITQLPLASDGTGLAGPPFQMPYSLNLPENERAYWSLHLDLLDASSRLVAGLAKNGSDGAIYATTLASLDAEAKREFSLYAARDTVRTGRATQEVF